MFRIIIVSGLLIASAYASASELSRADLITLQRQLAAMGYPISDTEGDIGDDTRQALSLYRQDYDLAAQQWLNAELAESVNQRYQAMVQRRGQPAQPPPALPQSDTAGNSATTNYRKLGKYCVVRSGQLTLASTTRKLQLQLGELGYRPGNIVGVESAQTRQALSDFQRDHELADSGRADSATQNKLLAALQNMRANRSAARQRQAVIEGPASQ